VFCSNLLKSDLWSFGPSVQFSTLSLAPKLFKPIQRYFAAEVGYSFAFGKKVKVVQSSFIGYRKTELTSVKHLYSYIGYVFQLGLRYDL
jgi:outer membrane phospholipase A